MTELLETSRLFRTLQVRIPSVDDPVAAPLVYGGAISIQNPGLTLGQPTRDSVFGWGYNRGSDGNAIDPAEPLFAYVIENNWVAGDDYTPVVEHYLNYGGANNVGGGRMFFIQIDRINGRIGHFEWNVNSMEFRPEPTGDVFALIDQAIGMQVRGATSFSVATLGMRGLKQAGVTMLFYNASGYLQLSPEDGSVVLGGDRGLNQLFSIFVGSTVDMGGAPTGPALRYDAVTTNKWQWSDDGTVYTSFASILARAVSDPSGVTAGWVLTADGADGFGWAPSTGGGGSPFATSIEIFGSGPYITFANASHAPIWYEQVNGTDLEFYSTAIAAVVMRLTAAGVVSFPFSGIAVGGIELDGFMTIKGTGAGSKTTYLDADTTSGYLQTTGTDPFRFLIGNTEALRIRGDFLLKLLQQDHTAIPVAGAAQDGVVLVGDDGQLYFYSAGARYTLIGVPA